MTRTLLLVFTIFVLFPRPVYCAQDHGAETVLTDRFTREKDGDPPRAWDTIGVGWEVRRGSLECDGLGRSTAAPISAPHAAVMVVEANVTPHRAIGKDWKLAGIVIQRDNANYWQLGLVEKPEAMASAHYVELAEMRNSVWSSQGSLKVTDSLGGDFNWEFEHTYHLRLEITSEAISGKVSETDGTVRARIVYAFSAPAVKTGMPMLFTTQIATGFAAFRADVGQKAPAPPRAKVPAYDRKDTGLTNGNKTGFFHVERAGDRWWIIDPKGRSFYAVGTDHVNYYAHFSEKLGYAPYSRNVEKKFGSEDKWAADAVQRLKRWNFNTLGAGCIPSTHHRGLVHTEFLSLGANFTSVSSLAPRTTWTGFPDVFHPRFADWCEREARRLCTPNRDDPWLLGYFLDNELEWFGKNGADSGLVDEAFKLPAEHPAKKALIAFLRQRYPDIAAFNQAWKATADSWDSLAQSAVPVPLKSEAGKRDRLAFVRLIADRYFAATTAAVRKADPNHMVLGCRFAGFAPPGALAAAGKYCDIVSVNYYGQVDLERNVATDMPPLMRKYYAEAKRPLMQTEWSFPALDAGLPSQHGAGQRVATQKDKAQCYTVYQRALFSLPFMVGSDYFMWADEPKEGISPTFPEDSNYGLVDVNDDTWQDVVRAATRVNPLAQRLHGGDVADLRVDILDSAGSRAYPAVRVANLGRHAAAFTLHLWVQGKETLSRVSLAPGASTMRDVRVRQPAFVSAEADPEETVLQADRSRSRADGLVNIAQIRGRAVVVINPTGQTLTNVPAAVALGKAGPNWTTKAEGVSVQVDALPGGPELALRIPSIPPRNAAILPLVPGTAALSRVEDTGDRDLAIDGPLRLEHRAGSGDFFDRVSLDGLELGRFRAVIHQALSQQIWVSPHRTDRIIALTGPVRTVLVMTASLDANETGTVKTAAGDGVYAPLQRGPNAFQTTYRLTCYTGEQWFAARFLQLVNKDTTPWRFAGYFYYAISSIGGKAEKDQPRNSGSAPLWFNAESGASYGAVIDRNLLQATYWKDASDGPGEHPDIWRDVNMDLTERQVVNATSNDPEALFYGSRGTEARPGGDALERLKLLSHVRAVLTSGR